MSQAASSSANSIENALVEQRIQEILDDLSIEEKARLCHGNLSDDWTLRFEAGGIERLGIKQIKLQDGPLGIRATDERFVGLTTAMPCTLGLSCTWDTSAAYEFGQLLGEEMLAVDAHVLLAPGVNLMRSPLCGRNFEYLGEDPFLAGKLAAHYIRGMQSKGVAANVKHLVANDCEYLRHYTTSNMDARTLREMHLLPFEIAIREGQAWTLMTSNSIYNNVHCAENIPLLRDIIRNEFDFDGVAITDWRGSYLTQASADAGTDLTSGFCAYVYGEGALAEAVNDGLVSEDCLDEMAKRNLRLYFRTGLMNPHREKGALNTEEHHATARRIAAQGMVLLKNEHATLPLEPTAIQSLLITGPGAEEVPAGSGSSLVIREKIKTPLQAFQQLSGESLKIIYSPMPADENGAVACEESQLDAAKKADAVVFFATAPRMTEGRDIEDLELLPGEAQAIAEICKVNSRVIVVLMTAAPVNVEPWIEQVQAVLVAWYGGQAAAEAIVDVVTGEVTPGGKLSFTWAKHLKDYACHAMGLWPARPLYDNPPRTVPFSREEREVTCAFAADYEEGIFMGYRWFDRAEIQPRFPFGHGLSYTNFNIDHVSVNVEREQAEDPLVTISMEITNTGQKQGTEVIQVYVQDCAASVARPPQELKEFQKVSLKPGESTTVKLNLSHRAFAFWSEEKKQWTVEPGAFLIKIGTSSRDILSQQEIRLKQRHRSH